jgi:hypothetical protein
MKIVIEDETITSEKTSKGTDIHKQRARADIAPGYSLFVDVSVERGQPYKRGEYGLSPRSYKVGRFGGLELDPFNTRLVQLTEAKGAVRAA